MTKVATPSSEESLAFLIGVNIYKQTSSGKTQIWRQELDKTGRYRTVTGQLGGKEVTSEWTQAIPTNVGKKNERLEVEQARFEVLANYKKKLDKEYCQDINDIAAAKVQHFLPMLAHPIQDYPKKVWSCGGAGFAQPKLDGMRCVLHAKGMFSRNGKPIVSAPHVFEAVKPIFEILPDLVLDGELYNHEYKDDFDELMSVFKKGKPTEADFQKSKEIAQYHIYDLPSHDGCFDARYNLLESGAGDEAYEELAKIILHSPYLFLVETRRVSSQEQLDSHYERWLEMGYEGLMWRLNTPYERGKRSSNLLKKKDTFDAEYELVDLEPGRGNWAGKAKRAILRDKKTGETFDASVLGTMAQNAERLANKHLYIGKPTTVTYQILTPRGVPRFGRVKEFDRQDV